jgi:hypothetical protein
MPLSNSDKNAVPIFEVILDASGFRRGDVASILALLLYSLQFLSLPL